MHRLFWLARTKTLLPVCLMAVLSLWPASGCLTSDDLNVQHIYQGSTRPLEKAAYLVARPDPTMSPPPGGLVKTGAYTHLPAAIDGVKVGSPAKRTYVVLPAGRHEISGEQKVVMLDYPKTPGEKAAGIEANVAGTMLGVLAEGGPIMGNMGKRNHVFRVIPYRGAFDFKAGRIYYPKVISTNGRRQLQVDEHPMSLKAGNSGKRISLRLDQKESKLFVLVSSGSGLKSYELIQPPLYSPDNRHIAFLAENGQKVKLVLDGEEMGDYLKLLSYHFSETGGELYFITQNRDRLYYFHKGGRQYGPFENIKLTFAVTGDGAHFVFAKKANGIWSLVRDGQDGPVYDLIAHTVFGGAKGNLAFSALKNRKLHLVYEGRESPAYDNLWPPYFSSSGDTMVCRAEKEGKQYLLLNLRCRLGPYTAIVEESFCFSPDGKHFAFICFDGQAYHLVIDGKRQKPAAQQAEMGYPVFSPDGQKLAWVTKRLDNAKDQADKQDSSVRDHIIKTKYIWELRVNHRVLLSSDYPLIHYFGPRGYQGVRFSEDGRTLRYTVKRGEQLEPKELKLQ